MWFERLNMLSVFNTVTFQSEDAISQCINNVVERGFVRNIEKIFVVRVAGDELDLLNESFRVLLSPDVMTQDLKKVRNVKDHMGNE